ncbi:uncharacterized protein LOC108674150 [Hyalella azteca]|uniref:Uncharacterized protein LOC108674150 n=1 Tax=Hyalella azteca TaxID=294128 RepID=A0A8B7NUV8_HYAAZ|nr:uncharacterized protein LOC108674150 [Hyalella azteca]
MSFLCPIKKAAGKQDSDESDIGMSPRTSPVRNQNSGKKSPGKTKTKSFDDPKNLLGQLGSDLAEGTCPKANPKFEADKGNLKPVLNCSFEMETYSKEPRRIGLRSKPMDESSSEAETSTEVQLLPSISSLLRLNVERQPRSRSEERKKKTFFSAKASCIAGSSTSRSLESLNFEQPKSVLKKTVDGRRSVKFPRVDSGSLRNLRRQERSHHVQSTSAVKRLKMPEPRVSAASINFAISMPDQSSDSSVKQKILTDASSQLSSGQFGGGNAAGMIVQTKSSSMDSRIESRSQDSSSTEYSTTSACSNPVRNSTPVDRMERLQLSEGTKGRTDGTRQRTLSFVESCTKSDFLPSISSVGCNFGLLESNVDSPLPTDPVPGTRLDSTGKTTTSSMGKSRRISIYSSQCSKVSALGYVLWKSMDDLYMKNELSELDCSLSRTSSSDDIESNRDIESSVSDCNSSYFEGGKFISCQGYGEYALEPSGTCDIMDRLACPRKDCTDFCLPSPGVISPSCLSYSQSVVLMNKLEWLSFLGGCSPADVQHITSETPPPSPPYPESNSNKNRVLDALEELISEHPIDYNRKHCKRLTRTRKRTAVTPEHDDVNKIDNGNQVVQPSSSSKEVDSGIANRSVKSQGVPIHMTGSKFPRIVGLENRSKTTCYLNAGLQLLGVDETLCWDIGRRVQDLASCGKTEKDLPATKVL